MLLGHFAVAFAAKRYAPRTSLGTLILAAQLLDLMWPLFLLVGWEHVQVVPGIMKASPFDFQSYPISHSLLMAVVWGAALSGGYHIFRRYPRGAMAIAVAVVSHWFLDAVVHRPDLPLWPGASSPRIGLGLWNSISATILIELALLTAGVVMYSGVTRPRDRAGTRALAAMVGVLVLIFISGFFSPAPSERTVAIVTLGLWLFVPLGYWIDAHRQPSRLHGVLN